MLALLFLLSLFPVVLDAQITGTFPACAVDCIFAITSSTCANLDVSCFCSQPSYVQGVQSCLSSECTTQDYLTSATELIQVCASYGISVTVTLPSVTVSTLSQSKSSATVIAPATTSPVPVSSSASKSVSAPTSPSPAGALESGQQVPISSGLSTGAEIGIGVGVGLGALLVLGLAVILFCLRRRRHNRPEPAPPANDIRRSELDIDGGIEQMHNEPWLTAELPGTYTWYQQPVVEMKS